MVIHVLFFGMLKDVAGRARDSVDIHEGAVLSDLLRHYEKEIPHLKDLMPSVAISINQEYATKNAALHAGDEVALLPPVSGGSPQAQLVRRAIETTPVVDRLRLPEDGAAVVFEGVVRNNTKGRPTLYLDYEAYEVMALQQLEGLVSQARDKFHIREAVIVHRLGRLEIGETSVLIAVASAHRAAAFEACRWIIDTLKKTVPIWKKEYFEDGAVWADGEPFPAEILPAQGTPGKPDASK